MKPGDPEGAVTITLHESSERLDKIDLKDAMTPPWHKRSPQLFETDTPEYKPYDLNWTESRHLEEQITALAIEQGASCSEHIHEELDSKRSRLVEAHKKAFVFEDLTLHDLLVRNIQYVFGVGGGALLLKAGKELLLQWLKNKATREIHIKKGDISLRLKGESDLQKAHRLLERLENESKTSDVPANSKAVKTLSARNRAVKKSPPKKAAAKKTPSKKA